MGIYLRRRGADGEFLLLSKFPSATLASINDAAGIASFGRHAYENLSCIKH
jgi:hypothetical protein